MRLTADKYEMLISEAQRARSSAYAPYSGFTVGAAALCEEGRIYRGFNIENASYSATVCAERVAIYSAMASGEGKILAVAVVGAKANEEPRDRTFPCGVCLQVMRELCPECEVVTSAKDGIGVWELSELLPHGFDNLKG